MTKLALISIVGLTLRTLHAHVFDQRRRAIGRDVHKETLQRILLAPVNKFFDVTPIGKIMQIFTEDLNVFYGRILDAPKEIFNLFCEIMLGLSIMFAVGRFYVPPLIGVMAYCMYYLARPYLYADNQLHKVGKSLHSPWRSYMQESIRGSQIIRAFKQEKHIQEHEHAMVDRITAQFIAHHSCWCWFNLRMTYLSKLIPLCATIVCVVYKGKVSNSTLCILFNQCISLGWLPVLFAWFNWFQRMMVQVQRVFNLHAAPQEKYESEDAVKAEASWPQQGKIEFKDVELRYRPNTNLVLKKLNFEVTPGHKVGVVGRTGAGKSTLSMALTRIVELADGKIEIDGQDISKLPIADLRNQITMIPQDPVMFSGSLRFNLDPFDEAGDDRITELIKKAGLEYLLEGKSKVELEEERKALAKKLEMQGSEESEEGSTAEATEEDKEVKEEDDEGKGLKFKVKEEGKNLSVGERQLICIIRAILRSNRIVILDEATANIDVVTEQTIQKLIDEEFKGATVICIAHRLNTIIRSDRVLVMGEGRALEYDSPQSLMANSESVFSQMLKEKKRSADDHEF